MKGLGEMAEKLYFVEYKDGKVSHGFYRIHHETENYYRVYVKEELLRDIYKSEMTEVSLPHRITVYHLDLQEAYLHLADILKEQKEIYRKLSERFEASENAAIARCVNKNILCE